MGNTIKGLALTGPTASGKTKLSVNIALSLQSRGVKCNIINADSKQVYQGVPIITAQPTAAERRGVEHLLFGYVSNAKCLSSRYSVESWLSDCTAQIEKNIASNIFTIIVGGTMFYINSLFQTPSPLPPIAKQTEQDAVELYNKIGHDEFTKLVETQSKWGKTDRHRLLRNYCFVKQYQKPIEYFHALQMPIVSKYNAIFKKYVLLPPREKIYGWCNSRFNDMMTEGVLEEVEAMLKNGPVCDAIYTSSGFKYIEAFLQGKIDTTAAIALSQQETRHYAKRQTTWINNQLGQDYTIHPTANDIIANLSWLF